MASLVTVRLGRAGMKIPMPDRGGRLAVNGDVVDAESSFYRDLLRSGDLVVDKPEPVAVESAPDAIAAEPAPIEAESVETRRPGRLSGKV